MASPATLATDVVAGTSDAGDDVVVFAHGILGNKNNWKSFAKRLVDRRPSARAVLVDWRRHGQSHSDDMVAADDSVAGAVADVESTLALLGHQPRVLVGHSWGGKAMLMWGLRRPAGVEHVVVVDSPPGTRSFRGADGGSGARVVEEVERVVDVISSLPPGLARDRRHLVEQLTGAGLSSPIAQWMTTNLTALPEPLAGGLAFRWSFDLDGVRRMLTDFGRIDLWPQLLAHRGAPRIVMVRGGRSDRWRDSERAQLTEAVAAGIVDDVVLERAGHWVHTDDPDGLMDIIAPL